MTPTDQLCATLARAADEVLAISNEAEIDADRWLATSIEVHLRTLARNLCPCCRTETISLDASNPAFRRAYLRTLLTMLGLDEPTFAKKIGFDKRNLDKLFRERSTLRRPKNRESDWRLHSVAFLTEALKSKYSQLDLAVMLQTIFFPD